MAGAGSPFAVAGIASRTFSPTWGRVLTASRWIGSITKAITNRPTAVGRLGSSKCSIAAQTAASAIPMRSSQSMTCYLSGGWRVTEPRTVPWHQYSESATQTWGTSCEGRRGRRSSLTLAIHSRRDRRSSLTLAIHSRRGKTEPAIAHSSRHRYAAARTVAPAQQDGASNRPQMTEVRIRSRVELPEPVSVGIGSVLIAA